MRANIKQVTLGLIVLVFIVVLATLVGTKAGYYYTAARKVQKREANTAIVLTSMNPLSIGDTIPQPILEDLDYNKVELIRLLKKTTLITFFYPDCDACEVEFEVISEEYPDSADQQNFIFISAGNPRMIQDLVVRLDLKAPILYDHNREFSNHFGIHTYPFSLVVDERGVVRDIMAGPLDAADFAAIIKQNEEEYSAVAAGG